MQVMKDGRRKLATWMIEGGGLPGPQALNCVMAVNKAGDSPLLIACRNGWLDMAHHLLDLMEKSASSPRVILEKTGMNNESVLGWILKWSCSYKLDTALMDRVLRAGATPTLPCFSDKVPPVCLAAAGGYNEAIEKLCAHGADLMTAVDSVKRTPLHYAAAQGILHFKHLTIYVAHFLSIDCFLQGSMTPALSFWERASLPTRLTSSKILHFISPVCSTTLHRAVWEA